MASKKEFYRQGRERGLMFGQFACQEIGMGDVGETADSGGEFRIENEQDLYDARQFAAYHCESNDRQCAEFCGLAYEINSLGWDYTKPGITADEAWDKFEEGISVGIRLALRQHSR